MSEPATGVELLAEYENGTADYYLEISKNRRAAQDKFMQAYPRLAFNRVEAHQYLMDFFEEFNKVAASLPQNVKDFLKETFMEYGYYVSFNGLSFDGYSNGPMVLGGHRGRAIARARGSLLAEGLLADESLAGAKRYATHLYSFAEYDFALFKVRVTNLTDGGEPQIEYDPPEWAEGMPTKVDPNYQPG
jgi:hypothetical protein